MHIVNMTEVLNNEVSLCTGNSSEPNDLDQAHITKMFISCKQREAPSTCLFMKGIQLGEICLEFAEGKGSKAKLWGFTKSLHRMSRDYF